jgi:intein-encoded DNA endonuclease-like protein
MVATTLSCFAPVIAKKFIKENNAGRVISIKSINATWRFDSYRNFNKSIRPT